MLYAAKYLIINSACNSVFHHFFSDSNVMTVLRLAEEFQVKRLTDRCERFLLKHRRHYHPLDLINIACKYNLSKLLDCAIRMASRIPRVECYEDFRVLDSTVKEQIQERAMMNSKQCYIITNDDVTNNIINLAGRRDRINDGVGFHDTESESDEYDADSEEGFDDEEDLDENKIDDICETNDKMTAAKTIEQSKKLLHKAFVRIMGVIRT